MASITLNEKTVKNAKAPAGGRIDLWDALIGDDESLPGVFGLRVSGSGVKSWCVMYRARQRDGSLKQRRLVLGTYPAYGLREARQMAREALVRVARDGDPAADRKAEREIVNKTPTVADAVADFITQYAKPKNRSWRETERVFNRYVLPVWGTRLLPEIARTDVIALVDGINVSGSPYMANRVLATLRRFWNWLLEKGRVTVSPVANVRAPAPEVARDRTLSDAEIKAVWDAARRMGWPFGPVFQLLLVTGQRVNEVARMRWRDIDLDRKVWTLPREATKSDRLHEVPLSSPAIEILDSITRTDSDFVFTTTGRTAISGFSKSKARCDRLSGVTGWRLHDVRRTVASNMARLKVRPWVVEKVLNHQTGQLSGVAGVYNRHGYLDEKTEALGLWARHLESITRDVDTNGVPIDV